MKSRHISYGVGGREPVVRRRSSIGGGISARRARKTDVSCAAEGCLGGIQVVSLDVPENAGDALSTSMRRERDRTRVSRGGGGGPEEAS